ncbi:MAG: L-threonylcarbamoyladenylate synthase [Bacteroidota bacterium]|nr:L-threonylcarbamoyladenylate synthase [Bacteroidota bacterium]
MENFNTDITESLNVLNNGGIILYPTDTIWGIGCDATNAASVKKIYQLKKREEKKSMIILLAYEDDLKNYILHPSEKIIDFLSNQTKPTTAIFQDAINLPDVLVNPDGSIAIRIIKDDFCRELISRFKKPIVSTSANISGSEPPENYLNVSAEIKSGVDYIVQHRQNEMKTFEPSAIIRLNDSNEIEKIR